MGTNVHLTPDVSSLGSAVKEGQRDAFLSAEEVERDVRSALKGARTHHG